ncbi:hypothetical protein [Pseudomonas fluorescens]|uniref:Uncharacterized protein n=1 Tax=Pseudomonas fluorescens TaxID=294 RepID=A0AAE2A3H1_PSEFL|nr:hypothetical protein [Pseudomonas fluorescens]KIF56207.1 hypothetical protein QS95_25315 [Pseudomonas fluorescens]
MAQERDVDVDRILAITFDDFNGFLAETDAEQPCEACNSTEEWDVWVDDGMPQLTQSTLYRTPENGILYFNTMCRSCGNTRLFNAQFVSDYIRSRKK